MLVLTRRVGEEIVIDGNIRVIVVAVKGDKIRLGIEAPPSVTVDRKEVHDRRSEFMAEADFESHLVAVAPCQPPATRTTFRPAKDVSGT